MSRTTEAAQSDTVAVPAEWHTLEASAVVEALTSDREEGLSQPEARARLAQYGPNELPEAPPASPWALLLAQFSSLIIWVLIGAAVISGLLGEWVDAGAIVAIVLLNAVLGFVQEYRAERSLAALRKLSVAFAHVIRGGRLASLPARELVPGDLVQIEAGDQIPADARLVYATRLRTQEAALTGESTPVDKLSDQLTGDNLPLADRRNMLFLGTVVTTGKGRAVVTATGLRTELGRIASLMKAEEAEPTPLQRRLEQLGHLLLYLSLGIVTLVFGLGLLRGEPFVAMFMTAVSLAVAAIPEGLPAIVTITLALGVTRMVKRHALIRRLPAVETLGSTTVICTDKTGTLTKNEMTVTRLFVAGHRFVVTGEGYTPVGMVRAADHEASPMTDQTSREPQLDGVRALLEAAVLCNGAALKEQDDTWHIIGDPTEGALLVVAAKRGLFKPPLEEAHRFIGEVPFDPERKMMTVIRQDSLGPVAYVKGAPDVLLARCTTYLTNNGAVEPLTQAIRQEILGANSGFAREALRVLGMARRQLREIDVAGDAQAIEQDLTFLGLAAMKDPLRPEAIVAVDACRQAGIRTVMITGDHRDTAVAIAGELGILHDGVSALSGPEVDRLAEESLAQQVERVAVYARVSAEHKLRVVRAWKERGAIVAMTGDGVNDAPAVRAADIGVAMGMTGTDVTKEASDMVVTDDNFASIAAAVEEGRVIYANILKSVHFLLSCNISEVLLMLLATLLAFPLPLLPVQILWINLVTDGLPALALAVDPADPDVMRRQPRKPAAPVLSRNRIFLMTMQGVLLAVVSLSAFSVSLYWEEYPLEEARTVAFTVMVFAQLFHAFNCRSNRLSVFKLGLLSNRALLWAVAGSAALQVLILVFSPMHSVFRVTLLAPEHWLLVLGCGLVPVIIMETWKMTTTRSR